MTLLWARRLEIGPLRGVNVDLQAGLTLITGDEGCGTTLLLRVLAGQVTPDEGDVGGGPCLLLSAAPGDEWSPAEVVTDTLGAHALVDERLAGRQLGSMSSGERQRVRLARTLMDEDAAVLLLDEPFGYLDGAGSLALLNALRVDGRPALIVAKASEVAPESADRVLTLVDGQLG